VSLAARAARGLARRLRGPYRALARIEARLDELEARLARAEAGRGEALAAARRGGDAAAAALELLGGEVRAVLRALVADESGNRRRLHRLRAEPGYEAAWAEEEPLVSVTIATRGRPELLAGRALPSILGQSYERLEVVVVGDHADEATERAVRGIGDARVSYANLTQRLPLSDDPRRRWLVAATMARNEAMRLARGRWVVSFDDDDAMRPDCVERLLAHARAGSLEAVYGRARVEPRDGAAYEIGVFPPECGQFTWASALYHGGLRFFERELVAADLGVPGDWYLAERMLRAGVRFGMVDAVLCDVFPSGGMV